MAVRGFLTAFDNIDKDHDHVISHEDLHNYAREQNMPEAFVQVFRYAFLTMAPINDGRRPTLSLICPHLRLSSPPRPPYQVMLQTESLQRSFLSAYAEIDLHQRGCITHDDLKKFAENAHLPDSFTERWITLFDPERTGSFTYEHFCEVIGLNKKNPASPAPTHIKETVEYKCSLSPKQKSDVTKYLDKDFNVEDSSGSMQQMLLHLDKQHGPRWRCRVLLDEKNIPAVDAINKQVYAFSPDGGAHKYLIWRQKEKRSGGCCACFV